MAQLSVNALSKQFGGIVALQDVSFDVQEGEVLGLIGPNGAGKTTLFNCVSRFYDPDGGSISFDSVDLLVYHHTGWCAPASPAPSKTSSCSRV